MSAFRLDYNLSEKMGNRIHGNEPILYVRIEKDFKWMPLAKNELVDVIGL